MAYRLSIFSAGWIVAAWAICCGAGFCQSNSEGEASSAPGEAAGSAAGRSPQELFTAARAALETHESVVARLRQRIDLFGKRLSGTGTYVQGSSESQWLRYELKFYAGSDVSTVEQVSDGRWYWERRSTPRSPTRVTRVNLRQIAQSQEAASAEGADEDGPPAMGHGGLRQLLLSMESSFEFHEVEPAQIGRVDVQVIAGSWRPDWLARFLPEQQAAMAAGEPADLTALPEELPDQVRLFLGCDDLFPYRIEYSRQAFDAETTDRGQVPARRTLVLLEFYDVEFGAVLDAERFAFDPGDAPVTDITKAFISRR